MNFWDILIICIVVALIVSAVLLYRKGRSSGCCSAGCSGCSEKGSKGCPGCSVNREKK